MMKKTRLNGRQAGIVTGAIAAVFCLSALIWKSGFFAEYKAAGVYAGQGSCAVSVPFKMKMRTKLHTHGYSGKHADFLLPEWIQWKEKEMEYRPAGEEYAAAILKNRRFALYKIEKEGGRGTEEADPEGNKSINNNETGRCIFESKAGWRVSDVLSGDIDGDGNEELLLLVWKRGSFGNHLPFWIEENDDDYSQHIFIYRFDNGEIYPKWMSSALGIQIRDWNMDEAGRLHVTAPDGSRISLMWKDFGLKLIEEETEDFRMSEEEGKAGKETLSGAMPGRNPMLHSGVRDTEISRIKLIAVGDNLIHAGILRSAYEQETESYDFSFLYEHVKEQIQGYDLAVVNQETIFINDRERYSDFPDFASPAEVGIALAEAGFDIITGANNHCMDQGVEGIEDTLGFWKNYPEVHLLGLYEKEEDAGKIKYLQKNGICLAIFNYTYGLNDKRLPEGEEWRVDVLSEKQKLIDNLKTAESKADISVCFLHIGEEYSSEPSTAQKKCISELVNAGADLIICTHPHVVEPYGVLKTEEGNSAAVFYSLGNFIANQPKPETVLGGAASITITKREVKEQERVKDFQSGAADGTGKEEDKTVRTEITEFELIPVVCHWGQGKTEAYFLSDYTQELAKQHGVNRYGANLSLDWLRERFEKYRKPFRTN